MTPRRSSIFTLLVILTVSSVLTGPPISKTLTNSRSLYSGDALQLRGERYALSYYTCTLQATRELGYWKRVKGGLRLTSFWSGRSEFVDLENWEEQESSEHFEDWLPDRLRGLGIEAKRESESYPNICGHYLGESVKNDFDWMCSCSLRRSGKRIEEVRGPSLEFQDVEFTRGDSYDKLDLKLGSPEDVFEMEGMNVRLVRWLHQGQIITAAVDQESGELLEFGLRVDTSDG